MFFVYFFMCCYVIIYIFCKNLGCFVVEFMFKIFIFIFGIFFDKFIKNIIKFIYIFIRDFFWIVVEYYVFVIVFGI